MTAGTRSRSARVKVDTLCTQAVDLARAAVQEQAEPGQVGEHEEVQADAERVVTHLFACLNPGYVGWRWAATVSRAPRSRHVTVDEVVLLPGPGALLPPEWLPWSERLRPGDLGVGDLLPTPVDDERLVPGYAGLDPAGPDDPVIDAAMAWELGLGRARVLSRQGRDEAAQRWLAGAPGPSAPIAVLAPAQCSTCGFFLALAGSMGQAFGVCTNEYAPDDAKVVAVDHGCGAHSEVAVEPAVVAGGPIVDEIGYDVLAPPLAEAAAPSSSGHPPGSVDPGAPAEDLGHS